MIKPLTANQDYILTLYARVFFYIYPWHIADQFFKHI